MTKFPLLSVPEPDANPRLQADWLELTAFFSDRKRAFLTELVDQQDLEWDQEPDDFGDVDERLEDIAIGVTAEVGRRRHDLGDAYPFDMSADGTTLALAEDWTAGQAIYLFCLVLSHTPRSEVVPEGCAPHGEQLREARELFQVCATLAAAGRTGGPSFSIGWPRIDGVRFLEKLHEIWQAYGDGVPQDEPPPGTSIQHKDEGIDVISYWPERDGKPGIGHLVGQVASGNDWPTKSVLPALSALKLWFKQPPAAKAHPALFIPFSVADEVMARHTLSFGYVAHRLRLPDLAGRAPFLGENGVAPIERLDELGRVYDWLARHRRSVLRSTAL